MKRNKAVTADSIGPAVTGSGTMHPNGGAVTFQRSAEVGTFVLALVWLGILFGVSFVATPVKFTADTLTLPVALDVGGVTFHLLNKIEWILLGALGTLVVFTGRLWIGLGSLALLLATQTFWLLPILDERVSAIIGGTQVQDAPYHWLYVGADLLILGTLVAICAVIVMGGRRQIGLGKQRLEGSHMESETLSR